MSYHKNFTRSKIIPKCASCEYIDYCDVCIADLLQENNGKLNDCDNCGETYIRAKAMAEHWQDLRRTGIK